MSDVDDSDSAATVDQVSVAADSDGEDGSGNGVFPMNADPAYPDAIPAVVSDADRQAPIDRGPGRVSAGLTLVVAVVGVAVLSSHPLAVVVGMVGSVLTLGALTVRSRRILFGATTAFVAMGTIAGLVGGLRVGVVGVLTGILVWDLGTYALSVGETMGRAASTRRVELVNAATSIVLASVAGVAALALASVSIPTLPVEALLAFLLGGTLLFAATRP